MPDLRRREFATLFGVAAWAWPLAARAQQPIIPTVGFLSTASAASIAPFVEGFRRGLDAAGFVEGRNVAVEYRWADNQHDRLPTLAAELVAQRVAVIVTGGATAAALAAKDATSTIPIVFAIGADPVKLGLVASMSRPSGNVSGATFLANDLVTKQLQLLQGLLPPASVIGVDLRGRLAAIGGRLEAFRQSLSEAGFDDGRNVTIEYSWDGQYDHLPARAADLARRRVSVIVATSTPGALAAKAATSTVPIVFNVGVDPVEVGLVSSLSRPGGNLTGASILNVELGAKQLELLHEVVPTATKIALLVNPTSPALADPLSRQLQVAAKSLALKLQVVQASNLGELEAVFASLRELQVGALVIASDPFLNSHSEQIAALALRNAMPTMHQYREFPAAGGLMGYGGAITDSYRLVGEYTGRILKGEKPADLPVQQLTKVELAINLETAKALGLKIPDKLLALADEVIE